MTETEARLILLGYSLLFIAPFLIVYIGIVVYKKVKLYKLAKASLKDMDNRLENKQIIYYDVCPGCGAKRSNGASECEYCGHDLIQDVKWADKAVSIDSNSKGAEAGKF